MSSTNTLSTLYRRKLFFKSCFRNNFRDSPLNPVKKPQFSLPRRARFNTSVFFFPCQPVCRRLLYNRPDAVRVSASGGGETVKRLWPVQSRLNEPAGLQQQQQCRCSVQDLSCCFGFPAFWLCSARIFVSLFSGFSQMLLHETTEITLGRLTKSREVAKSESVNTSS